MTNAEKLAEARKFLATPNLGKDMARELNKALAYMWELADIAEAAEARVKELEKELDAALARIAEAWALHEPFTWSFGFGPVQSCKWCADNGVPQEVASWPCPTVLALESVQPSSGVDEDALVQRVYDELMTDDAVAEVWSNGKVMATARRIVKFAVQGGESRGE